MEDLAAPFFANTGTYTHQKPEDTYTVQGCKNKPKRTRIHLQMPTNTIWNTGDTYKMKELKTSKGGKENAEWGKPKRKRTLRDSGAY